MPSNNDKPEKDATTEAPKVLGGTHPADAKANADELAAQQANPSLHPTPWGEQIAEAFEVHERALTRSKENREARKESVDYWDGVYNSLAELKRRVEHVEDSPIRDSKMWGILANVDTTRDEPEG